MKPTVWIAIVLAIVFYMMPIGYAQEMTREEIIEELNLLKGRIGRLEKALETMEKNELSQEEIAENGRVLVEEGENLQGRKNVPGGEVETTNENDWQDLKRSIEHIDLSDVEGNNDDHDGIENNKILRGRERGLEDRWEALEKRIEGIDLSGAVEIEAAYEHSEPREGATEDASDLVLETVELVVDAKITDQMRAHILFDFEEGEGLDVDEAIIHFRATDVCVPDLECNSFWYANIGKMVVPFGYFETHFVSDPLTQKLGETKETALVAGAHKSFWNLAAGAFNGNIDESDDDDHIENFVAAGFVTLPEDTFPEVHLVGGVSYISNIADSDEFTEFIKDEFESDTIENFVAGASAFVSLSFEHRYYLEAEWVCALNTFSEDRNFRPQAWNLELAFRPVEVFEVGFRYGGSDKALDFLPQTQLGAIAVYDIFENTSLALEYLFEDFDSGNEVTTVTTQLAIEFD